MPGSEQNVEMRRRILAEHGTAEVPLRECMPWCVWGDGHPGEAHYVDQWCGSPEVEIPLRLHPSVVMHDGTHQPETARVYAMDVPGRVLEVVIGRGDEAAVRLTVEEALALAEALRSTLAVVDQGGAS